MQPSLTRGHPRLYLTPGDLPEFRALARGPRRAYRDELLRRVEPLLESAPALRARLHHGPEHRALALGQAWRLTGDERYGRAGRWLLEALEDCAHNQPTGYDTWGVVAEAGALLYDWLHDWWRATGLEERAARVALYCARRALDEALRVFIVDDWHNYGLGLQAGALAGALAVGDDHPRLEDGTLLRTMRAFHFTGLVSEETFLQDAYHVPRTVRRLEATLRAGGGSGFAGHLESTGGYHTVDCWELMKLAEWWTSALRPSARGRAPVWPEVALAGEAILHFARPDGRGFVLGDGNVHQRHHHQANVLLHLQARTPRPHFAAWLAQHRDLAIAPFPTHLLLRAQPAPRRLVAVPPPTTAAHFDPITVLRSGWTPDATMVTFRCGRHAGGHNHLDHNSFTIFRGGALAIDSGGNGYEGPLRSEYSTRTIAHNAILVRDPREKHWLGKYAHPTANDGGQRLATVSYAPPNETTGAPHAVLTEERRQRFADEFDLGRHLAFVPGAAVDYVAGDATRAYTYPWSGLGDNPSRRVEEAVRQLVFLKPDLVVVFDRVEATEARFAKSWLLHTIGAPHVGGRPAVRRPGVHVLPADGPFEFAHERGRMTVWPLLPQARAVRAIGGAGYENWLEHAADGVGRNVPSPPGQAETGAWRLEVAPLRRTARTCFLTVLHAGLRGVAPARDRFRCRTGGDREHVELTIEARARRAWTTLARLRFRTAGAVEVEHEVAGARGGHRAPAPERVPTARWVAPRAGRRRPRR